MEWQLIRVMPMATFQDTCIHKSTGIEYRYEAEYAESSGRVVWSATVSLGRRRHHLAGVVEFDAEATPAWSAVAANVRSRIAETDFAHADVFANKPSASALSL